MKTRGVKRQLAFYSMLLIPIVYFAVFCYLPIAGSVVAFKDYNIFDGIWKSKWVGLAHFAEAFSSIGFWYAIRNTLLLNMGDLLLGFPVPIIMAIALNELRSGKMRKVTQVITFLPYFLSMVIVSGIVYQVFSYTGIVNNLLRGVNLPTVDFLGKPLNWMLVYWVSGIWKGMGYGLIIYLAALMALDPTLNEAAYVDGAGRFKRIFKVTLPLIRPTIMVMFILNIGQVMNISFDRPYLLGNVLVKDVANVISTHVYTVGLQSGRFDYATAIGLFQSVVGIVMIISANLISHRFGEEGII